jgi:hypothetical protein
MRSTYDAASADALIRAFAIALGESEPAACAAAVERLMRIADTDPRLAAELRHSAIRVLDQEKERA